MWTNFFGFTFHLLLSGIYICLPLWHLVSTTITMKMSYDRWDNPRWTSLTFGTFVEGDCNRAAKSAALNLASNLGAANPFVINSIDVGNGATHLAIRLKNEMRRNFPSKKILFESSEVLNRQLHEAIRSDNLFLLLNLYKCDALTIDGIHLFSFAKNQDAFFELMTNLHKQRTQLIMTTGMDERSGAFHTRLQTCFHDTIQIVHLNKPDLETRTAILKEKVKAEQVLLPEDVIELIAAKVDASPRVLEGALCSIMAEATLTEQAINRDLASRVIQRFIKYAGVVGSTIT